MKKEYVEIFLNQYRSEQTKRSYKKAICKMYDFIQKPEQEIEKLDVTKWIQSLQNLASNSQALYISGVKAYFKFLNDNDIIDKNFDKILKRPKIKIPIKDALSKTDAIRMLNYTENPRNRAIIGMYLSTGLRVQELIDLQYEDYINNSDKLTVKTKGDKIRTVILNPTVKQLIDEYLKVRKEGVSNLFVNNQGHKMNAQDISNMLKRIANKLGIEGNISNHTLRSTFITDLAMEHGIVVAQRVVGHSNIETTKRYIRGIDNQVEEVMRNIAL